MLTCPYVKYNNEKFVKVDFVWKYFYHRRFIPEYYIWLAHGEYFRDLASTGHRGRKVGLENNDRFVDEEITIQIWIYYIR